MPRAVKAKALVDLERQPPVVPHASPTPKAADVGRVSRVGATGPGPGVTAPSGTMGLVWRNEQAPKVATEYLSGLGRRWDHVRAVGRLADALSASGKISSDVAAAAWLHDLGYAEELSATGFHPLDGAGFLASEGAPAEVVSLVAHHTGADFEAEERGLSEQLAGMPAADPDELGALTLLDLVTAPDGTLTDPETRIAEILNRYPVSSPVHRAVSRSRAELLASAERAREQLGLPDEWPAGAVEGVLQS